MHICCANCAIYPFSFLKEKGFKVKGFFYNPNIHPYTEYKKRLDTLKEYEKISGLEVIYKDEYKLEEFLRQVVFRENIRCRFCYNMRLEETAKVAKDLGFKYFTTTLLYSVYQDHEFLKSLCDALAKRYDLQFLYFDFREGWLSGIKVSKELGLYRQRYCGCIFSERDRYLKKRRD